MPRYHNKNGVRTQFTAEQEAARDAEEARQAVIKLEEQAVQYKQDRRETYPSMGEFLEAYCEKEIGGSSTKWDAYKIAYNKVRTDNPKE
jgi:hypothetical protein